MLISHDIGDGRPVTVNGPYHKGFSFFGEILYSRRYPEWPLYDLYAHDASMDYDTPMWDGPVVD